MFKRVQKRRQKKEEEEELGLDEDMKEVLGIQDTDSEESDSDSDDESSLGNHSEEELDHSEDEEAGQEELGSDAENGADSEDDSSQEPPMSVKEAIHDPIYLVSLEPDVSKCVVCPGKLLKGSKMIQLHRTSNACTLSSSSRAEVRLMLLRASL